MRASAIASAADKLIGWEHHATPRHRCLWRRREVATRLSMRIYLLCTVRMGGVHLPDPDVQQHGSPHPVGSPPIS
jgi:hypothetical protein